MEKAEVVAKYKGKLDKFKELIEGLNLAKKWRLRLKGTIEEAEERLEHSIGTASK